MLAAVRQRLTYANVVSSVCLFMLLGGVAYAVTALPRDSVGTRQLRNNAVISSKVEDRSLLAKDFKTGQLPRGPRGLQGRPGDPGTIKPAPLTPVGSATQDCGTQTGRFCEINTTLWQAPTNSYAPLAITQDAAGFVHLTGGAQVVKNDVCPILYLPAAMRPGADHAFPVVVISGFSRTADTVRVLKDGGVDCPASQNQKDGDVVDLSTITFRPGG